jgi:hypothetical protein
VIRGYLSILILLVVSLSCEKDEVAPNVNLPEEIEVIYPEAISVGDISTPYLNYFDLVPDEILYGHNYIDDLEIDMDADGITDFLVSTTSAYPLAGTVFNGSSVRIKSISDSAFVSVEGTGFPKVYNYGDSLVHGAMWGNGEITISSNGPALGEPLPATVFESSGPWFGIGEAYLGVKLSPEQLGWIKISLPSTDLTTGQSVHILEYGILE